MFIPKKLVYIIYINQVVPDRVFSLDQFLFKTTKIAMKELGF